MSDGSALLPQPLTVQGQLVAGGLTIVGPNSPYSSFLPGAPTIPTPSGVSTGSIWDWGGAVYNVKAANAKGDGVTDDGVAMSATDAAAVGKGVAFYPGGTYATTVQKTFTAPIVASGTHATIFAPTALGTGVPAYIFNPPGASAIDWRFPVCQGVQFKGPGSYSLGNKVAGVDGVRLDSKCVMRDCSVRFFDSGIVFNSATGHISLHNVVSTSNYYNVYQLLGNQDHLLFDCDLTGANFAGFAAPGNVPVQRVTFIRTHFGYEPFCRYQEANGAASIFLWDVTMMGCPNELVGNNMDFSENIGQAGSAGYAGNISYIDPGFSFSNTYKIAARPQDWAINLGDAAGSIEIRNGSSRLVNGTGGAVQVNTSEADWNIYGDAVADTYTIPTHPEWVNRWGAGRTPALGRLGTQRQAIGDSGGINDLVITDTTAIAGITLAGSGGNGALRLNGTTWEWLVNGLGSVHTSLTTGGQLLVKDLRLTRQVPTEAVLVSGVDPTLGGFIGTVTLTAARVIGAPLSGVSGQRITFSLLQGGAGAFAVTWNAIFKGITGGTSGATGTRAMFSFIFDGFNWNLDGAQPIWV